jgi:hypothetical protein
MSRITSPALGNYTVAYAKHYNFIVGVCLLHGYTKVAFEVLMDEAGDWNPYVYAYRADKLHVRDKLATAELRKLQPWLRCDIFRMWDE